jgi:recombination protein RecA
MAKKKTEGVENSNEELLSSIMDTLNKDGGGASFLAGDESSVHLTNFISTSATLLDFAIANRKNGGIPVGRISELAGLEGSGKSLICAHLVADVQRRGGIAIYFDTEYAVSTDFFEAVGVNLKTMIHKPGNRLEEIFAAIMHICSEVRRKGDDSKEVLIILDSIAAAKPASDIEQGTEQTGYGTEKSKFLSRIMPDVAALISEQKIALVFTNQLRQKLNVQAFQDPYKTTGGMTLPYYYSVRVRLSKKAAIKNKFKEEVGLMVEAKVVKNRCGPPGKKASFAIYYDRGIDNTASWLDYMKTHAIIEGASGNYKFYDRVTGEEFKFKTNEFPQFVKDHPVQYEQMYDAVADTMVMQYASNGISTADGTADVENENDGATDNAAIED